MGPSIIVKQNELLSLRYLAAMRQTYSYAKDIFTAQMILATLFVVLLSFVNIFYNIEWFLGSYCVFIAILDTTYLNDKISSLKENAAIIQEMFDTYVLDIEWNSFIERIDNEVIFRYSEKYKKKEPSFDSLKDWYSVEICAVKNNEAKFICQYSNSRYDLSLKKKFNAFFFLIIFTTGISIIGFSFFQDMTLKNFVVLILLPLLPGIIFSIQRIKENNRSLKTSKKLKTISLENWLKLIKNEPVDIHKFKTIFLKTEKKVL